MHNLPETGFVRITQIIGDRKRGIPGVLPLGPTAWWCGIRDGRYPAPVRIGLRAVAWKAEDIHALLDKLATEPYVPRSMGGLTAKRTRKPRQPKGA